jgi:hypothetical protein
MKAWLIIAIVFGFLLYQGLSLPMALGAASFFLLTNLKGIVRNGKGKAASSAFNRKKS